MPIEFDCTYCGMHIVSYMYCGPPSPARCRECCWVALIPDEETRARVRVFLRHPVFTRNTPLKKHACHGPRLTPLRNDAILPPTPQNRKEGTGVTRFPPIR